MFKTSLSAFISLLLAAVSVTAADHEATPVTPDAALAKLKEGNARFSSAKVSAGKPNSTKREETAKDQRPYAIIITCADSRTGPEIVFDANIGDLFVVRNAGNVVDEHLLGSIEYAVEHLGVRLIVVMGHQRCGAVTAAIASDTAPGHVQSLVRDIQAAVKLGKVEPGDVLDNTIAENARLEAERVRNEADLGEKAKEVRIIAAVYKLDTGTIEWGKDK